jgi:hypothetical protein
VHDLKRTRDRTTYLLPSVTTRGMQGALTVRFTGTRPAPFPSPPLCQMFGDLSRRVQQLLASIRAKQEIVNTQVL